MHLYSRMNDGNKQFTQIFVGVLVGIAVFFVIALLVLVPFIGTAQ